MLTQTMPALINALSGALPQNVIAQITQALGNCNQPITHRSGVNVQPNAVRNSAGSIINNRWDPSQYTGIFPNSSQVSNLANTLNQLQNIINTSNYQFDNSLHNYEGSQFNFPTTNEFSISEYYGGPTNYFGGNTEFVNTVTQNLTTNNINTTTINGNPAPGSPGSRGPSGPAGERGVAGQNGRDSAPGAPGASGLPGMRGMGGRNGRAGLNGRDGRDGQDGDRYVVQYKDTPIPITTYKFNPTTCSSDAVSDTITISVPEMRRVPGRGEWNPPWDRVE
jgi:hypothetical protein